MKCLFVFAVCVLCSFHSKKEEVFQITIIKTNLMSETPVGVDCDGLEAYFSTSITRHVLKTSDSINRVIELLKDISPTKLDDGYELDVRAKMFIEYKSGQVDTVCLSRFRELFLYNGKRMEFKDKELIYFIDRLR